MTAEVLEVNHTDLPTHNMPTRQKITPRSRDISEISDSISPVKMSDGRSKSRASGPIRTNTPSKASNVHKGAFKSTLCADAPPFDISKVKSGQHAANASFASTSADSPQIVHMNPPAYAPERPADVSFDEPPSPGVYAVDTYFVGDRSVRYTSPYGNSQYASDPLCYRADSETGAIYMYNTITREVHTIPFIPQGLTPLPQGPQKEMYLIKPAESEEDNIHYPNYLKKRNAAKRCDNTESHSVSHEEKNSASADMRARKSETITSTAAEAARKFKAENSNKAPAVSEKLAKKLTVSTQNKRKEHLRSGKNQPSDPTTKPKQSDAVLEAKKPSSTDIPKKIPQKRSFATKIYDNMQSTRDIPFQPTVTPVRCNQVNQGSQLYQICLQMNYNTENTSAQKHMNTALHETHCEIPMSEVDEQIPILPPRRLLASKIMSVPKNKGVSEQPRPKKVDEDPVADILTEGIVDMQWIDTAPIAIQKKKKKECSALDIFSDRNKKKKIEAKAFQILLSCISKAKKDVQSCQARDTRRYRDGNAFLRKDYQNILEKADACRKNPAARILLLQEALPLAEQTQSPGEIHLRLIEMAELYNEVGEFKKAQEYAERVVAYLKHEHLSEAHHRDMYIRCNVVLGRSHESLVQPERAKPYFDEALSHVQGTDNPNQEASVLGHLGIVHELMGDYTKAFELYNRTLDMTKSLSDRRILCETSANLGLAHLSIGDLDIAEKILAKNIPVARSLRDYTVLSRALTNMAHVQLLKGNLDMAGNYHEQELELNQENQDSQGVAQALSCLGNVRKASKNYVDATKLFIDELMVVQRLGNDTRLLESLGNCGSIYRVQHMLEKAREFHQRERLCAESTNDPVYLAKAVLNLADVDLTEAQMNAERREVLLRTAIERFNRSLYLVCEAVPPEERQLYMIKVGCCEAEWRSLDGLENAYRLRDDGHQAVRCADAKHLPLVTQSLRNAILSQEVADNRFENDSTKELTRASPTDTQVEDKRMTTQCHVNAFLKKKFYDFDVYALMESTALDVIVLYSMFWDEGPEFFAYVMHKSFADWKIIPLEFSAHASNTLASQRGKYRTLIAGDDLDMPLLPHAIYSRGEQTPDGSPDELASCMRCLYNDFFKPLEETLATLESAKTVCMVTDGLITNIPFAMLRDHKGRFLAERYALSTIPSIEQLHLLHERRKRRGISSSQYNVLGITNKSSGEATEQLMSGLQSNNSGKCTKELASAADLSSAAQNVSADLVVLNVPTVCEMREDYTGCFQIENDRVTSENIVDKWKGVRWQSVFCDGFSCFTYRVIHESTVSVTRAMLAAGADRVLGMLWTEKSPEENAESTRRICDRSLRQLDIDPPAATGNPLADILDASQLACIVKIKQQFLTAVAMAAGSDDPCAVAKSIQKFQCQCIRDNVSEWLWGRFTLIGLP